MILLSCFSRTWRENGCWYLANSDRSDAYIAYPFEEAAIEEIHWCCRCAAFGHTLAEPVALEADYGKRARSGLGAGYAGSGGRLNAAAAMAKLRKLGPLISANADLVP